MQTEMKRSDRRLEKIAYWGASWFVPYYLSCWRNRGA